jgi:hypothetical protein
MSLIYIKLLAALKKYTADEIDSATGTDANGGFWQ